MSGRSWRIAGLFATAWFVGTVGIVLLADANLLQVVTSGYWLILSLVSALFLAGGGVFVYWPTLTWRLRRAPRENDVVRGAIGAGLGLVVAAIAAVMAMMAAHPRSLDPSGLMALRPSDPGVYIYVGLCVVQGFVLGVGIRWATTRDHNGAKVTKKK
jgi:hypothetical protein